MGRPDGRRRLVVNADDFGRSHSINEAVIRAHREGILTSASLMVGGEAFDEAVAIARRHPRLGVGLHLTLVCGRAVLGPGKLPGLVDVRGCFSDNAPWSGFRYWALPSLREPLRAELTAQFEKFHATGLVLDHVNGHLHLHLHPVILDLLREHAREWRIQRMRLTRDSLRISRRTSSGFWAYRLGHAAIFGCLSRRARPVLARLRIRHTDAVFGLLQDGRVDAGFLRRLLPLLPVGDLELYSHPSLDGCRHEFEALIDPGVIGQVRELGIELVRYQDL